MEKPLAWEDHAPLTRTYVADNLFDLKRILGALKYRNARDEQIKKLNVMLWDREGSCYDLGDCEFKITGTSFGLINNIELEIRAGKHHVEKCLDNTYFTEDAEAEREQNGVHDFYDVVNDIRKQLSKLQKKSTNRDEKAMALFAVIPSLLIELEDLYKEKQCPEN